MRVGDGEDEAGVGRRADLRQRIGWPLDAATHDLIVVVGADGPACALEGDDIPQPVIAPGVVDAVRLEVGPPRRGAQRKG